MALKFYNTLTREKENFSPINKDQVLMYTCGPTVNNYAHLGNLRAYVFADVLEKSLLYLGYPTKRVMNITDIGILSSDADTGEDKMTAALVREGKELTLKSMRELADFYTEKFKDDLRRLNIKVPENIYFASDYVKEDVELIKKLEEKGFAYQTSDGIYFDTAKFPNYGSLRGGKSTRDESHARITENKEKKNPEDFALWKFSAEGGSASGGNVLGFDSNWGKGFPGWHIECSAIGINFLGEQFDIHTGGIDLIPTHHTNEIAQSEAVSGKSPFVKYWIHSEHIDIAGAKMAKSAGNFLQLASLLEKNINPLSYRLWLLMGHHRTKMNFSWEALEGAETALHRLHGLYLALGEDIGEISQEYQSKFKEYIEDDLDTPRALTVLWDVLKDSNISDSNKKATVLDFDKVLGLGFADLKEETIPEEVQSLVQEREQARKDKNFDLSDELRDKINTLGYEVKDTELGTKVSKLV